MLSSLNYTAFLNDSGSIRDAKGIKNQVDSLQNWKLESHLNTQETMSNHNNDKYQII